jgi:hypothetical protein
MPSVSHAIYVNVDFACSVGVEKRNKRVPLSSGQVFKNKAKVSVLNGMKI